jgi:hypothetical protein
LIGVRPFILSDSSSTATPFSSSIQALYPLLRWSAIISSARSGSSVWDLIIQAGTGHRQKDIGTRLVNPNFD